MGVPMMNTVALAKVALLIDPADLAKMRLRYFPSWRFVPKDAYSRYGKLFPSPLSSANLHT